MTTAGFKMLTHDLRPPIRGGAPIFDGTFPYTLPTVEVDRGPLECSFGWNFVRDLSTGIRIAGLWPDGRPSAAVVVEADEVVERGDECRAASLRLLRCATADEWRAAIREHSERFGVHAERMTDEQIAWRAALARPLHDDEAAATGLRAALRARGLDWAARRFPSWRDIRDARRAWATRDARAARDALRAWGNARDARDAWATRDALGALSVTYAALMGWTEHDPLLLTTGLRDAYRNGLEYAVPTGPGELGYVMVER